MNQKPLHTHRCHEPPCHEAKEDCCGPACGSAQHGDEEPVMVVGCVLPALQHSSSYHACTQFKSHVICYVILHHAEQRSKVGYWTYHTASCELKTTAHPRRQYVTTSMVGLKGHICKNLTQNGELQRYSWDGRRRRRRIKRRRRLKLPIWKSG